MAQTDNEGPVVALPLGKVHGAVHAGTHRFLSIPYAAPPVGALRFQPPQPPSRWTGERDCTVAGPVAPNRIKPFPGLDVIPLVGDGGPRGDDYLTLNVWAPADAGASAAR